MSINTLEATIKAIASPGKGILAADESTKTMTKRLDSIGVESTEENRRNYRAMLFTTPKLGDYVSGVILYDETLKQNTAEAKSIAKVLEEQGIVPGIKVDKGLSPLPGSEGENITQGLDGLAERLAEYKKLGAHFTKWRALLLISDTFPSTYAIHTNACALARYASIAQANGFVPIVEPELLMEGNHDIERCRLVTERTLHIVFDELFKHRVSLEHMVLKPSMVISGSQCAKQATPQQVAKETLKVLRRTVPAAVPTINFLSGGQPDELATEHLNLMNQSGTQPWLLSFSYGRALQASALKAWAGKNNVQTAQQALLKRAALNSAASLGKYNTAMESKEPLTACA